MGTKSLKPLITSLYDEDFAAWTSETARQLRAGRFSEIDVEHVAEEIEDMGKSRKGRAAQPLNGACYASSEMEMAGRQENAQLAIDHGHTAGGNSAAAAPVAKP